MLPPFRFRHAAPAVAGLVLLPVALSGCVVRVESEGYKHREEKRFWVTGTPDVKLATFDGSIVVRGWDRNEVYVEVEKRGRDKKEVDALEVVTEQAGSQISVEVRQPSSRTYAFGAVTTLSRGARVVASVPATCNIMLRSGDGSLKIERVNGRVELRSSDGSISGFELAGDIFAHTEDGSVRLDNLDGRVDAATDDGSITIHGRLDAVRARTGDGSVVLKALPGSQVAADWGLSTGDGTMVVYVPDGFGAEFDAQAGNGRARFDSALAFHAPSDQPRGILRGRLGDGGRTIRVRTGDGSISLKRLPGHSHHPGPIDVER